jgi:hypothetical protein
MDYKTRIFILKLSRKELAARLRLTYASLSSRLNGFTPWQDSEERELQKILGRAEARQSETVTPVSTCTSGRSLQSYLADAKTPREVATGEANG